MTTPNKCEHRSVSPVTKDGQYVGYECAECRVRFVPADVLEEARVAMQWALRALDKNPEHQATASALEGALRRIDEVLGK
jgi:hypothetical protein